MNQVSVLLTFISFVLSLSCNGQMAKKESMGNQYIIEDYLKKWKSNKRYTMKVLEAMPETHYNFKPTDGMKAFKSQANHMANWLNNHIKKVGHPGLTKVDATSKETLIASFNTIFDELLTYIETIDPNTLGETSRMWYGQSTKSRTCPMREYGH